MILVWLLNCGLIQVLYF